MENFDEKQSLQLIAQMIKTAKNRLENNSFFFLLWGWAVLISSIAHYYLMVRNYNYDFLPWPTVMTIAAIVSTVYGYRMGKKSTVKSYFDQALTALWLSISGGVLLTLIFVTQAGGFIASYTALLLLYGTGTLATGIIIRFTPLIAGGVFIWICAAFIPFLGFPVALLVTGASVLGGYIIPGYMLRAKRERKQTYAVQ